MKIFKLPDLGEGLPDAIIREWYINAGDTVTKDQPMVAMETAKALVDVPVPFSGKIEKLFGATGDTINTGSPLVGFEGEAEHTNDDAGTVVGNIESNASILNESNISTPAIKTGTTVKVLPAVRMLAKQLGVNLDTIQPQGGHITIEAIKRAANLGGTPAAPEKVLFGELAPLSGVRRAMATSMTQAHQQVVPASIMDDANLHQWQDKQDITLRIIHAITYACQQVPQLNNYYDGVQMASQHNPHINIGIAVDTEHGLYAPVLKDVANRSDASLRADIDRFKQQAKDRSIPQEDLKNATIVMSNVGAIAGQYAVPVVTPPMVAIVALGRIKKTVALLDNGKPVIHPLMPISITFDHRPVTGGEAARFLKAMITALEKPSE